MDIEVLYNIRVEYTKLIGGVINIHMYMHKYTAGFFFTLRVWCKPQGNSFLVVEQYDFITIHRNRNVLLNKQTACTHLPANKKDAAY